MSHTLRKAVWRVGPQSAGQRFVLLALAENADLDGRSIVPLAVLCDRCCGMTGSLLQILRSLESSGWLRRDRAPNDRIVYQLSLDKLGVTPDIVAAAFAHRQRIAHQEGLQ